MNRALQDRVMFGNLVRGEALIRERDPSSLKFQIMVDLTH